MKRALKSSRLLLAFPFLFSPLFGEVPLRIDLDSAVLVIPSAALEGEEPVPLTVHLHGAAGTVEEQFLRAELPGVLLVVNRPGLSSAYREFFAEPERWAGLMKAVSGEIDSRAGQPVATTAVTLSAFSAGFGGVRELLRQEGPASAIATLILADSLHAGFAGDREARSIDPGHMKPFLDFAAEAAEGNRRLLLTHSEVATPGYASTTETADWLVDRLGGSPVTVEERWNPALTLTRRYRNGGVTVLGFRGATAEDHLAHLRNLSLFLRAAGRTAPVNRRRPARQRAGCTSARRRR